MKNRKKLLSLLLVLAMLSAYLVAPVSATGDGEGATPPAAPTVLGTFVSGQGLQIAGNASDSLTYSFTPVDSNTYVFYHEERTDYICPFDYAVTNASTGESVNGAPFVNGSSRGWYGSFTGGVTYHITLTVSTDIANVNLMLNCQPATNLIPSLMITPGLLTGTVSDTDEVNYDILRINGNPVTTVGYPITWTSSDPTVVEIDSTPHEYGACKINFLKAGTATVTVSIDIGVAVRTATCEVTVIEPTKYDKLVIGSNTVTLPAETHEIRYTFTPAEDGIYTLYQTYEFEQMSFGLRVYAPDSSDMLESTTWSTFTGSEYALGTRWELKSGTEYQFVFTGPAETSLNYDLQKVVAPDSMAFPEPTMTGFPGVMDACEPYYTPIFAMPTGTITYEIGDTSIAAVQNNMLTYLTPGQTTLTAKLGDLTATCNVQTRTPIALSLDLENSTNSLNSAIILYNFTIPTSGEYVLEVGVPNGAWVAVFNEADDVVLHMDIESEHRGTATLELEAGNYTMRINPGMKNVDVLAKISPAATSGGGSGTPMPDPVGELILDEIENIRMPGQSEVYYTFTPETAGKYLIYVPHAESGCPNATLFAPGVDSGDEASYEWFDNGDYVGYIYTLEANVTYFACVSTHHIENLSSDDTIQSSVCVTKYGVPAASLSLDITELTVPVDGYISIEPAGSGNISEYMVTLTAQPIGADLSSITVTSSDPDVISYNRSQFENTVYHTLVPHTDGVATITISAENGVSTTLTVTVGKGEPVASATSIAFENPTAATMQYMELIVNATGTPINGLLNLIASPAGSQIGTIKSITVSDPSILTYTYKEDMPEELRHQLIPFKAGTVTVTVTTDSDLTASCEITVNALPQLTVGSSLELQLEPVNGRNYTLTPNADGTYAIYCAGTAWRITVKDPTNGFNTVTGTELDANDLVGAKYALKADVAYQVEIYNESGDYASDTLCISNALHPHALTKVAAKNPTYTSVGNIDHWHCDTCDTNYSDMFGTEALENVSVLYDYEILTLDESKTVTLDPGTEVYYSFTPVESGEYVFYAEHNKSGLLVVEAGATGAPGYNPLGEMWTLHGIGYRCTLEAGKTYFAYMNTHLEGLTEAITNTVTVSQLKDVESLSFNAQELTLHLGEGSDIIKITQTPAISDPGELTFTYDENIVNVFYDKGWGGIQVVGIAPGTATVTVTSANGKSASVDVTVVGNEPEIPDSGDSETHTLVHYPEVSPTDTEPGVAEHYYCTECGKNFWDANAESGEVADADLIIPPWNYLSVQDLAGTLTLDTVKNISLPYGKDLYYAFTPETSGDYLFYQPYSEEFNPGLDALEVLSETDAYAPGWWRMNYRYVTVGTNIGIVVSLEKGTSYIFGTGAYASSEAATGSVSTSICITKYGAPATSITTAQAKYEISQYLGTVVTANAFMDDLIVVLPDAVGALVGTIKSVTVSDPSIVEYTYYEDFEPDFRHQLMGIKPGTVTVTITTEAGLTTACELTVKALPDLTVGSSQKLEMEPNDIRLFRFTPKADGTYTVYRTKTDLNLTMSLISETDFKNVTSEPVTSAGVNGFKYTLKAGTSYILEVYHQGQTPDPVTDTLYLTMDSHTHNLSKVAAKEATYTEAGNIEYYACAACDKKFSDAAATKEVTNVILPKLIAVVEDKAEVSEGAIDAAIEEAATAGNTGEVKLDLTHDEVIGEESKPVSKAEIPVAALEKVAEADAKLTLTKADATVTIDNKALKTITEKADGASVTLVVEEVKATDLTEKQQAAIEDKKVAVVISAEIINTATQKPIGSEADGGFGGGKVTVQIPFTPEEGTKGEDYVVLYIADDGTVTEVKTAYKDGCLVIDLEHFSEYVVVNTNTTKPSEPTEPEETTKPTEPEETTKPTEPEETTKPTEPEETTKPGSGSNPPTGDKGILIPMMMLLFSAAMLLAFTFKKKFI